MDPNKANRDPISRLLSQRKEKKLTEEDSHNGEKIFLNLSFYSIPKIVWLRNMEEFLSKVRLFTESLSTHVFGTIFIILVRKLALNCDQVSENPWLIIY